MKQTMYLVMDLVPGDTLTHILEVQKIQIPVSGQKKIFKQLVEVLEYL